MMHPLVNAMLPDSVAELFATVNKEDIAANCASKRGETTLILEKICSAKYTCVYDATWPAIPEADDTVALMIFYVRLHTDCTSAQRNRITELLHRGSANPLLLFMQHEDAVYLSVRFGEHFVKVQLPPQLPVAFVADMDIRQGFPAHLRALYNRWIGAVYALALVANKQLIDLAAGEIKTLGYCPLPTPQQSQQRHADIAALAQQLAAVRAQLKACRFDAGKRVPLGNLRYSLTTQLINLLPTLNEND